jgi:hypothetical protein
MVRLVSQDALKSVWVAPIEHLVAGEGMLQIMKANALYSGAIQAAVKGLTGHPCSAHVHFPLKVWQYQLLMWALELPLA